MSGQTEEERAGRYSRMRSRDIKFWKEVEKERNGTGLYTGK